MTLQAERPIRSILIAGSGIEAWLTAALLAHRLDGRQIEIRVCPVTGSNDWDGLYTALPAFPGDLFRELGYSDLKLARLGDASFSLGTRYESRDGNVLFKPHGAVGINVSGVGFHQYWRCTSEQLTAEDYFAYSPATIAMGRQAFAPPVPENAIGPLQHEMVRHIDPWAMQKQLRHQAYAMGVTELRGVLRAVSHNPDGRVAGINTSLDEDPVADLYIDCSGPHRSLLAKTETETEIGQTNTGHADTGHADTGSQTLNTPWEPAALANRYQMVVSHQHRTTSPEPYATLSERGDGWHLALPRGSEDVLMTLRSAGEPGSGASEPNELAGKATGLPFLAGHLTRPWQGNCVALGNAAASLLPVEPLQARYFMAALERLVRLLPGRDCDPAETAEYNQLCLEDAREAHALGSLFEAHRQYGDLTSARSAGVLPDWLSLRLKLFSRRGWIAPRDSQLLPNSTWSSAFILLGVVPETHDRLADRIPREQVKQNLGALKAKVHEVAHTFPDYDTYFKAVREAAAGSPEQRT